jgi:hypothetical protein
MAKPDSGPRASAARALVIESAADAPEPNLREAGVVAKEEPDGHNRNEDRAAPLV